MGFDLQGYVTVNDRLRHALDKWPDLRVQETAPQLVEAGGQMFIQVTTTVWRTPDDPLPAIASIWEPYPGTTPYTRGSEQANASTSSLGRCLGLMGVAIEAGMASKDEVVLAKQRNVTDGMPTTNIQRSKPGAAAVRQVQNSEPEPPPLPGDMEPSPGARPATEKQLGYLERLARDAGETISAMDMARYAADSRLASQKIEQLKGE